MWHENLPDKKAWSQLWYDYAICGRCRGVRAPTGRCPVCGDPPFDQGLMHDVFLSTLIAHRQGLVGAAQGPFEDWIYLRILDSNREIQF